MNKTPDRKSFLTRLQAASLVSLVLFLLGCASSSQSDQLMKVAAVLAVTYWERACIQDCSSKQGLDSKLNLWIGRKEIDLIARVGAPTNSQALTNGNRGIEFKRIAKTAFRYSDEGRTEYPTHTCDITFVVRKSTIVDYFYLGNGCYAKTRQGLKIKPFAYFGVVFEDASVPLILYVRPGSPAFASGLNPGDTIVQIGETRTLDVASFGRELNRRSPGDSVEVTIVRGNSETKTRVALGEMLLESAP